MVMSIIRAERVGRSGVKPCAKTRDLDELGEVFWHSLYRKESRASVSVLHLLSRVALQSPDRSDRSHCIAFHSNILCSMVQLVILERRSVHDPPIRTNKDHAIGVSPRTILGSYLFPKEKENYRRPIGFIKKRKEKENEEKLTHSLTQCKKW